LLADQLLKEAGMLLFNLMTPLFVVLKEFRKGFHGGVLPIGIRSSKEPSMMT
jgi:hypothetical protein